MTKWPQFSARAVIAAATNTNSDRNITPIKPNILYVTPKPMAYIHNIQLKLSGMRSLPMARRISITASQLKTDMIAAFIDLPLTTFNELGLLL